MLYTIRDNNGGAGPKDEVFTPVSHDFVLFHSRPVSHDGKNFLTPSLSLRALRNPAPPPNTLLLFNFPITIIIFLKTKLEVTNKFIPSNQTNF